MTSISVLIPVFNNDSTIYELVERIQIEMVASRRSFEVVLVNDGSSDDSWNVLKRIVLNWQNCTAIDFSRNFGQHPAINAGLTHCYGDIIVLMDADLQDLPEEINKLLLPLLGAPELEIVYSTFTLQEGASYRISSRLFNLIFLRALGKSQTTPVGTFRAFRAHVKDALLDYPERHAVYGPLMVQMGFENISVQVERAAPRGRTTSYTFRKRLSLAVSALISYSMFLQWLVLGISVVLMSLSLLIFAGLSVSYFISDHSPNTTQNLFIGFSILLSSVIFLTMGIMLIYITQSFSEILKRPRFHISKIIGTSSLKR